MVKFVLGVITGLGAATIVGALMAQWIERQFTGALRG